MTKVLLDTDILSEILKGKNAVVAARASDYLAAHGRFTTSAVSVAESCSAYVASGAKIG